MKTKSKRRTFLFILPVLFLVYAIYPKHVIVRIHQTSLNDADYLSWLKNTANRRQGGDIEQWKPPFNKKNAPTKSLTDCHGNTFPSTSSKIKSTSATGLVGIVTTAEKLERRMLIRHTILRDYHVPTTLTFRFIICRNQTEKSTLTPFPSSLLVWESLFYNDIDIVDCIENLNQGKTSRFFQFAAENYSPTAYKYLIKTDDDTFIHPINLANDLNSMPNEGSVYFGRGEDWKGSGDNESEGGHIKFFYGILYGISWDVVLWIREHQDQIGDMANGIKEDQILPTWFHRLDKKINYIEHGGETYFEHVWFGGNAAPWSSNYTKEAIGIHNVKSPESWLYSYRYYFGCS